jgi:hypothetical protein
MDPGWHCISSPYETEELLEKRRERVVCPVLNLKSFA